MNQPHIVYSITAIIVAIILVLGNRYQPGNGESFIYYVDSLTGKVTVCNRGPCESLPNK